MPQTYWPQRLWRRQGLTMSARGTQLSHSLLTNHGGIITVEQTSHPSCQTPMRQ